MFRSILLFVVLFHSVVALAVGTTDGSSFESGQSVETLLAQRLALMKSVAAYKWQNELPVEDLPREQLVVESSVFTGLQFGLVSSGVERFIQAQMDGAKEVQQYWISQWRAQGESPSEIPDLNKRIRPKLLSLGEQILRSAASNTTPDRDQFNQQVDIEGLSEVTRNRIFESLADLEIYPDRLTQILGSGILRIGTTGDYPPFSYKADGEQTFTGIDVSLGEDLATALGVSPVFVETSWPTLMKDLQAGEFDIVMSGVSRTLERQRQGYFSRPYHVGGKTAITRCSDRSKFQSLDAIDKPGVKVIVNPGGTNEKFVDVRISDAEKILYQDNRTIFQQITDGKADVMITDRIEADWQAAKNSTLCTPVESNFTYQEKAYLMPRDIALKEFVDTWLSLRIAEGLVSEFLSAQ